MMKVLNTVAQIQKNARCAIIVVHDAFDVLIQPNCEKLSRKFHEFDADMVVSAESEPWPWKDAWRRLPYADMTHHQDQFRYFNSGVMIGFSFAMEMALNFFVDSLLTEKKFEDVRGLAEDEFSVCDTKEPTQPIWEQFVFQCHFRKEECLLNLKLDVSGEISLQLAQNEENYYFDTDKMFKIKKTKITPIFIHGNGVHGKQLILENSFDLIQKASFPESIDEGWMNLAASFWDSGLEFDQK